MRRRGRLIVLLMALVVGAGIGIVLLGRGATSFASAVNAVRTAGEATSPSSGSAEPAPSATTTSSPASPSGPVPTAASTSVSTSVPDSRVTTATPTFDSVEVAMAYADYDNAGAQVEAAGVVTGVVERGGTCTLSLTQGAATVRTTSVGQPDATTTNCGYLTVPRAQLAPGTWKAVLSYRSATSRGVSSPMTVSVPA